MSAGLPSLFWIKNKMTEDLSRIYSLKEYSYQEIFQALFNTSAKLALPVAIWKLPGETKWEIIVGDNAINLPEGGIEELEPGFLLNKFQYKGLQNALYVKSVLYLSSNTINNSPAPDLPGKDFYRTFKEEVAFQQNKNNYPGELKESENEFDDFKKLVDKAVGQINEGDFQKVILSRRKEIAFKQINLIHIFENLSNLYTSAFTSLISIPGLGIWMGASPETLICVKDNIFKTCALAGTQQLKENVRMKDVLWRQKEIEEQAFVSRYVINSFKSIRLREFEEEGPKTVPAGNLLHLKTDFKVNMKAVDFPKLGSQMLEILHPTSAVCGMPHKPAFDFILENEKFDRELYAGYLGPVNINGSTDIFVNLRCMKVEENKAVLFAGVGITEDSDAEKEWQETEMKFRTLLNVM